MCVLLSDALAIGISLHGMTYSGKVNTGKKYSK